MGPIKLVPKPDPGYLMYKELPPTQSRQWRVSPQHHCKHPKSVVQLMNKTNKEQQHYHRIEKLTK